MTWSTRFLLLLIGSSLVVNATAIAFSPGGWCWASGYATGLAVTCSLVWISDRRRRP